MQLPPDEAVVMVSSVAPIKATKLRYYADTNFKQRVMPPPALADDLDTPFLAASSSSRWACSG